MRKYFYYVASKNSNYVVSHNGNFCYAGQLSISSLLGQTRALARAVKQNSLQTSPAIYKFDRNPPYKFLGIVS